MIDSLKSARLAGTLEVELLALDLDKCTRCVGSQQNIEMAFGLLQPVLEVMGVQLSIRHRVIRSEEEAIRLGFVSSPTIRINGQDIASELRESLCESCTELCGCGEGTQCRVWLYHGEEHTEAPVGLIVESALRACLAQSKPPPAAGRPRGLPDHLRRFFQGSTAGAADCCSAAEKEVCSHPDQKETCCHDSLAPCGWK